MDCVEFSRRRQRAGLTQTQLAEVCGIAQPHISAYESGRRPITPEVAERVSAATRQRPSVLVQRYRDGIRDLVADHRGSNIRVFGSVALGVDTIDSDLDLLITFRPGTHLGEVGVLISELSDLLGIAVDVVSEGALTNDRFSRRVLESAVPL